MGCCTGFGRVILIILNLFFLVISMALIALGVIFKFFTSTLLTKLLGELSGSLNTQTKEDFNIPNLEDVSELPFVGDIGLAFIVFGCVLFLISFLACCGACCRLRPLLVMFVILMAILVIAQAVVGGLFLAKDSKLHEAIKETVAKKVKNEFKDDGKDVFSFAINIMHYLLGCCGISGHSDFSGSRPASCCKRAIIDGTDVAKKKACSTDPPTAPDTDYNPQGCYVLLQDRVLSNLTLAAIILAAILLLQVLEIIFACLIIKDVNDENNKVGPF